jgi:hypothetical protein
VKSYLKKKLKGRGSVVECLPSKLKGFSSNPSFAKIKKERRERGRERERERERKEREGRKEGKDGEGGKKGGKKERKKRRRNKPYRKIIK